MDYFHCPKIHLPALIGLRSALDRLTVQQTLLGEYVSRFQDASSFKKLMLLSFGGHAFPIEDITEWHIPHDWIVVIVSDSLRDVRAPGTLILDQQFLTSHELKYIDLVSGCDVTVLKTGYGIVSEVILHARPALYVDRPAWREHESLVKALHGHTSADYIPFKEVMIASLELFRRADGVLHRPPQSPFPNDGARRLAAFFLNFDLSSSSFPSSL